MTFSHGLQMGKFDLPNVVVVVVDRITISEIANGTAPLRCPE